eukprot:3874521-Rhodomonas_salina.6
MMIGGLVVSGGGGMKIPPPPPELGTSPARRRSGRGCCRGHRVDDAEKVPDQNREAGIGARKVSAMTDRSRVDALRTRQHSDCVG